MSILGKKWECLGGENGNFRRKKLKVLGGKMGILVKKMGIRKGKIRFFSGKKWEFCWKKGISGGNLGIFEERF